ncbi:MAG TPA: HU family DNA-binding protein [Acidimicrobiales bacterium]|nr:HU family DNA-binding protein [Acidimicrobiales bacterium]
MNRRELVAAIAEASGEDKKTVDAMLKTTVDVITETVQKGDPVVISGFAKFAKVQRAARIGRNPATGAEIKIPAKTVAKITILKGFKDAVLAKPAKKAPAKKAAAPKR